jgi:hypothetical protein
MEWGLYLPKSVLVITKGGGFDSRLWLGLLDSTVCAKHLSVTCVRSMNLGRYKPHSIHLRPQFL